MTLRNMLTREVTINLNMFGPIMKYWIGSNVDGILIITKHDKLIDWRKPQLSKELSDPK